MVIYERELYKIILNVICFKFFKGNVKFGIIV